MPKIEKKVNSNYLDSDSSINTSVGSEGAGSILYGDIANTPFGNISDGEPIKRVKIFFKYKVDGVVDESQTKIYYYLPRVKDLPLATIAAPFCPFTVPTGKIFLGWRTDTSQNIILPASSVNVFDGQIFYTEWKKEVFYKITFYSGWDKDKKISYFAPVGKQYLPECMFEHPQGLPFIGWKEVNEDENIEPKKEGQYQLYYNKEFIAHWKYPEGYFGYLMSLPNSDTLYLSDRVYNPPEGEWETVEEVIGYRNQYGEVQGTTLGEKYYKLGTTSPGSTLLIEVYKKYSPPSFEHLFHPYDPIGKIHPSTNYSVLELYNYDKILPTRLEKMSAESMFENIRFRFRFISDEDGYDDVEKISFKRSLNKKTEYITNLIRTFAGTNLKIFHNSNNWIFDLKVDMRETFAFCSSLEHIYVDPLEWWTVNSVSGTESQSPTVRDRMILQSTRCNNYNAWLEARATGSTHGCELLIVEDAEKTNNGVLEDIALFTKGEPEVTEWP